MPHIYGLWKIHEEGIPLRPIVNTIGSPTYYLAKFLAKKLLPFACNTSSFVKNSTSFVEWTKNQEVKKEDILVSFDIISLYTKIPVYDAIDIIRNLANKQTTNMERICLNSTYFPYKGNLYEQIHGISMGSPLFSIMANIYMKDFETRAINPFPLTPKEWKRYVDDIFSKW
jgi:hypothetical protein